MNHHFSNHMEGGGNLRHMGCFTPPPAHALVEASPNTSGTSFQCHQVSFNSSGTPPQFRGGCTRTSSNGGDTPRNGAGNFSGFNNGSHHHSGHLHSHTNGGDTPRNGGNCSGFNNGSHHHSGHLDSGFNHFAAGGQKQPTPMGNLFANGAASTMCTPQTSRQELDLKATVDKEVMEVNAANRRQFPQVMTQLDNDVFLGGFPCEEAVELFHQNDITHCVNVSDGPEFLHESFQTFQIKTRDEPDYFILDNHLQEFGDLMDEILGSDPNAKIYVHCVAGVNRSVTLMIGYMMLRRGFQLLDAIRHFRSCGKNIILDNGGFRGQLVQLALTNGEGNNNNNTSNNGGSSFY